LNTWGKIAAILIIVSFPMGEGPKQSLRRQVFEHGV